MTDDRVWQITPKWHGYVSLPTKMNPPYCNPIEQNLQGTKVIWTFEVADLVNLSNGWNHVEGPLAQSLQFFPSWALWT
jgi:hypothetical protein